MAGLLNLKLIVQLTGLGHDVIIQDNFNTTAPTSKSHQYLTQGTTNIAEAIELGDITTVELMVIKAVSKIADIDCNFSSAFSADIEIVEGGFAAFKPSGTVYLKNSVAGESVVYEVWVFGT